MKIKEIGNVKDMGKSKSMLLIIAFIFLTTLVSIYFIFIKGKNHIDENSEDKQSSSLTAKELNLKEKELQLQEKEINITRNNSIINILNEWINSIENRNDISHFYADYVRYYSAGVIPLSRILSDKNKFYNKWDKRKFGLSEIDINRITENKYKVIYDKTFDCLNSNNDKIYNGKVRSVLVFENFENRMLITEEYDEKIYYTNKGK